MKINRLHNWNLSYSQAVALQKKLACKVRFTALKKKPTLVAGMDCAFSTDGRKIIAVVIVLRPVTKAHFEIVEIKNAVDRVTFPYIPGLLSFREAPVCIAAAEKLQTNPDIFIIDGQGLAHPRRLGLAAHIGIFLRKPTIGCAKSRLIGTFKPPQNSKGSFTYLKDNHQAIGAVVRTRTNVKPVFVSVGNMCTLSDAVRNILLCATKYRLPEPTRLADKMVRHLKLKLT